jgi:PAS domain S-box-containing protein
MLSQAGNTLLSCILDHQAASESRRPWANVEPEVRLALEGEMERELARRSFSGAMVYFLTILVTAWTTPYRNEHPQVLFAVGALTLVFGVMRILMARRLLRRPPEDASGVRLAFLISLYGIFIVWGTFSAWTVMLYAGAWTAMFVLLATASLGAGASSSIAPDKGLAYRGLLLLIGPTLISMFIQIDRQHLALGAGTLFYLVFLLAQTREHSEAFWSAHIAAQRERIRGSADRRRAEADRASLVAAIEQSAEQIVITDVEGTIRYCNPAFERVTGYTRKEAVGQNPRILKSGKHDEAFYRDLWSTIASGGVWTGRFTNRQKDGTLYEAEGTITPIYDLTSKITGYVAAIHDVTERLRMEAELQQAQKMEGIGRLAGGVAHDFNNLLTVISGYSGLLETLLAHESKAFSYVNEIKKATDRASGLTRQLLTFSRKQLIRPKPLDLNVLVGEMHRILERLVGEDIEVTISAAPELGLVKADHDQMAQILLNLAANARDAMPNGGKLVITTANPSAEEVLLHVSDTGVGMDESVRPHIFEPFFTTKEKGRGTGLGLATVYGIVQQSDGRIDVNSIPGEGTTFSIYLPRIDEPPPEAQPQASLPTIRGTETILVVEDHDDVRHMVIAALEACGYRVLEAANGRAAIEVAGQYEGTIDLVVTDVIMPGMTGKELADGLALLRPETKVLFISGYSGEVIAHKGVLDASVAYLQKPFTPSVLAAKVREILGS